MHESPAFTGAFLFYIRFGFFSGLFCADTGQEKLYRISLPP